MPADTLLHDVWSAGHPYERYVGRWSRAVALQFVDWLGVPPNQRWLDVGCGTGSVTQAILERATPAGVTGIDPSEGFIAVARGQTNDARAMFRVGDALALPVDDGACDAAVSGLMLNFIPDPAQAVAEMKRSVRPGGTVALYLWDYAAGMQLIRRFWDAAIALDPAARDLAEGRRCPICQPQPLRALLETAGLVQVQNRAIEIPTVFTDFDDYWSPFLGGQGPAPSYCGSLPDDHQARLRERLRASLPTAPDGTIRLTASAFAVRAIRPD